MRKLFSRSFSVAIRQWRTTAIVYFIQLCLALTLGLQVFEVLSASIGHSLEINKLLAHYDHTVLTDFIKVHGASLSPLIGQLRWMLLVWLIFSVFLNAGLLSCAASPEQTGSKVFWEGGARYYFPFLKINLILLSLAVAWTLVIWLPVAMFFQPSLEYFSTEKYTVWLVLGLLFVYLLGLTILFFWSVVSRLVKLKTNASIPWSLRNGWRVFRENAKGLLGLLVCFGALQMICWAVFWWLEAFAGMTSPALILAFFVLQQAFVFFRIQIRQMLYTGIYLLTAHSNEASTRAGEPA